MTAHGALGRRQGLICGLHALADELETEPIDPGPVDLCRALATALARGDGLSDYALVCLVERAIGPVWAS